jgi:hypothetical protein
MVNRARECGFGATDRVFPPTPAPGGRGAVIPRRGALPRCSPRPSAANVVAPRGRDRALAGPAARLFKVSGTTIPPTNLRWAP